MMVGPLWYGTAVFQTGATGGVPNGTMVAYPPPAAINGAHATGALGGGLWLVSKHAPDPKAAAAFAQFMATSPKIQKVGVDAGLPQYVPDETGYLSSLGSVFADPSTTEASWKKAASRGVDRLEPGAVEHGRGLGIDGSRPDVEPAGAVRGAAPAVCRGIGEPGSPGRIHGQEPCFGRRQRVVIRHQRAASQYSVTQ